MDTVVTVSGPFAASPTVRRCDVGQHPLQPGEQWWRITDPSRGWANGHGVACATHHAQVEATFSDGHAYRVGGLFNDERIRWPQGPHLWIDDDHQIRLGIFLTRPSRQEIAAVQTGKARFGWTEQGVNGFLLFRYGDSPWNDAPFNPQRLTTPSTLQPLPRGTHTRVATFLVHADTGRIAAMRMFSWPAYFLNHVIASIHRLAEHPYTELAAHAAQLDFYRRYPDGPSLHRLVRTLPPEAVCLGGQRDDRPH
ncbi:hypothetical protein ACTOB_003695 [Actinoplanes oblitus]|uniref:Uncharacterized protein n=1 Tax=Actinoplanes oblitus TaxID=3040509 RepID=A0ABY8WUF9_9ACTN|nr:hypothetical protein [Actinoplanes oblitus]WIN00020.1 hypothetical protein ACTOB_003695 [Actinoplanes oblitus]